MNTYINLQRYKVKDWSKFYFSMICYVMLKSIYGSLIIKKDTILYHATDEEFTYKPEKKLLYTTFHPSEWIGYDSEYIVRIQLKRDIEVLFFIN